jgi:hypothetical protein
MISDSVVLDPVLKVEFVKLASVPLTILVTYATRALIERRWPPRRK